MMNNTTTAELIDWIRTHDDDEDMYVVYVDVILDRAARCPQDATEIVRQLGWDLEAMLA